MIVDIIIIAMKQFAVNDAYDKYQVVEWIYFSTRERKKSVDFVTSFRLDILQNRN